MTPEIFESLLIEQVNSLGLPSRAYPNDPKNYFPEHDPGEVLVRYEGRKTIDRDIAGIRCLVKFYAEIVVVTRQLRDTEGAYQWLEKIYNRLEGYTLGGMTRQLTLEVESFIDEKDGLWQFGQKWSVETDVVQDWSDDYTEENMIPEPTQE
jgi:hypothetical protein